MKLLYLLPLLLIGCSPKFNEKLIEQMLNIHDIAKTSPDHEACYTVAAVSEDYKKIDGRYCLLFMGDSNE